MDNVIPFDTAVERILTRRLACLRCFTASYYRCLKIDGHPPCSGERFREATREIERLERTLNGVRILSLTNH